MLPLQLSEETKVSSLQSKYTTLFLYLTNCTIGAHIQDSRYLPYNPALRILALDHLSRYALFPFHQIPIRLDINYLMKT